LVTHTHPHSAIWYGLYWCCAPTCGHAAVDFTKDPSVEHLEKHLHTHTGHTHARTRSVLTRYPLPTCRCRHAPFHRTPPPSNTPFPYTHSSATRRQTLACRRRPPPHTHTTTTTTHPPTRRPPPQGAVGKGLMGGWRSGAHAGVAQCYLVCVSNTTLALPPAKTAAAHTTTCWDMIS